MPLALVLAGAPALPAADKPPPPPRVTSLVPLAVPQGFSGTVRLRGVGLKDATAVRVDGTAQPLKLEIKEKKDAAAPAGMEASLVGDSEIVVELVLPAEAPAGPLPLVVAVGEDTAAPVTLIVCPAAALTATGDPGSGFQNARMIEAGQHVPGAIRAPRSVDVYSVAAIAGKRQQVTIRARGIASLLDPLLTVYDRNGLQLAVQDDASMDNLDAALEVTPSADGPIFLVVQDAMDFGSDWHSYLLEVAACP